LARSEAINTIINQYDVFKIYFNTTSSSNKKCYVFHSLRDMYNDKKTLMYLYFLKSILSSVIHLNKRFQSNDVNSLKLLKDLNY